MAESILKLKVDSQEYESKIKRASTGLKSLSKSLSDAGKTFLDADNDAVKFAQELGKMQTVSNSATGKVRELSTAFIDLKLQYKEMTDVEKASPYGKALSQSLDQLRMRVQNAKSDLGEINSILNGSTSTTGGGGVFGGDKLSGMLQVFGGNMMTKAAGAAMSFASEIGQCVTHGIELAKQGEGVRIAFERLGRGDILNGLREATHGTVTDIELMKAAVKFNDFKLPVEELGTMLAFAQQKAKDTGQSIDYMVDSIVTGLGRKSLMILDNLGMSAAEIKEKMKETGDMTKAVGEIIREQMAKAGEYVETAADRAAQANVSLQNKMEELGRKFAPLQEASNNLWTSMKIGILDIIGGPLTTLINQLTEAGRVANQYGILGGDAKVGKLRGNLASAREENRQSIYQQQQQEFWRYINRRENYMKDRQRWINNPGDEGLRQKLLSEQQAFGTSNVGKIQAQIDAAKKMLADYQQAAKTILNPEVAAAATITPPTKGKTGSKKTDPSDKIFSDFSTAMNKAALSGAQADQDKNFLSVWALAADDAKRKMLDLNDTVQDLGGSLAKLGDQKVADEINSKLNQEAIKLKDLQAGWAAAASSISAAGSALNQLNNPAINIMMVIGQAIATIGLAYAQTLAQDSTSKSNIYSFIAAAAAAVISMTATIASFHSATGYAEGGIIKGNSYSGDNIGGLVDGSHMVGLNAGEIVLNQAQQSNVAHGLQGGAFGGMRLSARLDGKDLLLSIDRTGQTLGYGQLVFFH